MTNRQEVAPCMPALTSSAAIYGSGGLINIGDFILIVYKSANSSSVRLCVVCVGDTVCCLNVCVCVCDTVHVFTQQDIGLFWGGFRTGESSYCIIQLLEPETAIPQGCILD